MITQPLILHIAIATPLRRLFDYLPATTSESDNLMPGIRVAIPFGHRDLIGIVVSTSNKSCRPQDKLKKIHHVIDAQPIFDDNHMDLLKWASHYYHHAIGEVLFAALPAPFRKNNAITEFDEKIWCLTENGLALDLNLLKKTPKQAQILSFLQQRQSGIDESALTTLYPRAKPSLAALENKGLIAKSAKHDPNDFIKINMSPFELNNEQKSATTAVLKSMDRASVFLLDGLTGSGKTEVYMALMESVIRAGKQCLILLPEIGLTPQQLQRFKDRFEVSIAIQHSGLSDSERTQYWLNAKSGKAKIIIGTRSAVWTPLANPGLYIIDEEHDLSYKQQDGFRYSAKDMLIMRATRDKVPAILGSATPSLETLYNVKKGRFKHLLLCRRTATAKPPQYRLLDIRGRKMYGPLSQPLVDEITQHLNNKNQVLLFLNRRGYAVHLFCHCCGWKAECNRCELPYTYHKHIDRLVCHHCGVTKPYLQNCPECDGSLMLMGHGTERIEEVLAALFPSAVIARIDRDTTRKKNAIHNYLAAIQSGKIDIMIGTQMLAKGHHFPNVTLTGIVDADRGLFSTDFRASERLAQLFMQISGRTGRGRKAGTVIVQTYNPGHPLFQQLIKYGYNHFCNSLLQERSDASLPPYSYMVFLRAEAHYANDAKNFIVKATMQLKKIANNALLLFGPIPALIEKRGGRYRYQLIIQSPDRKSLHKHIARWLDDIESLKDAKKVRWSIDVDPQDIT